METPPFYIIICVVVTLATIEAVPWFGHNPTKRQGQIESKNKGTEDFGVDYIGVNGGDPEITNGGALTRGDQNLDENQDEGEGVDDQGGYGNQFRRRFQVQRGIHRGRVPPGGLESNSRESFGGRGSLGGRGYPGSRRNEGERRYNGDDSEYTSDEDESYEDVAVRMQQEGYQRFLRNRYGSRFEYPEGSRFPGRGYPYHRDGRRNGNRESYEEEGQDRNEYQRPGRTQDPYRSENRRWQQKNPGGRGNCSDGIEAILQFTYRSINTNECQYGNQTQDSNSDVQNGSNENHGHDQNPDGELDKQQAAGKTKRGGNNNDDEGQAGNEGQTAIRGPTGNWGHAGNWDRASNSEDNGGKSQGPWWNNRGSNRGFGKISHTVNIGNGVGNNNTVYLQ